MKTKNLLIIPLAVVLFISLNVSAQCGMMGMGNNKQASTTTKKETATADTGKVIYTCPMHPEVKSDKPGSCPKCGMALVKSDGSDKKGMGMCGMKMNMDSKNASSTSSQQKESKDSLKITYTCPMHPEVKMASTGKCPKCGMDLEKKITKVADVKSEKNKTAKSYTCPMCEGSYDKPGKCTHCGMDLIEKKRE